MMDKKSDSDEPVYLVIGAYGGVGRELCMRLSKRGARLVIAGRDEDKLNALASTVNAHPVVVDACEYNQVQEAVNSALAVHGRLDGVANCVGSLILKPAHLTSVEEWSQTISTNLNSSFALLKFASKAMMATGGSIVFVSSAAAKIGLSNHEAIAAAKAGIEGMARSAAASYSRQKIRVNCVAPGMIETPLTQSLRANQTQFQASIDMHALGRIASPGEVASVIDWLLGAESAFVTGQSISVDGGLSSVRAKAAQR
ncbi:MAG: SDR family oxidoreductase [Cyanobacteria bacterium TGS_CYA1]|nr:SDR family oxidoreductase [Cyanobacteria bacterium TGS_CYA1]